MRRAGAALGSFSAALVRVAVWSRPGALVVAPVILTLAATSWSRRMALETAVAVMTATVVAQLVFGPGVGSLTDSIRSSTSSFPAPSSRPFDWQPATALVTFVASALAIC